MNKNFIRIYIHQSKFKNLILLLLIQNINIFLIPNPEIDLNSNFKTELVIKNF